MHRAGYFTSRPTHKAYMRAASAYLQAARQLDVLSAGAAADRDIGGAGAMGRSVIPGGDPGPLGALEAAVALAQVRDVATAVGFGLYQGTGL